MTVAAALRAALADIPAATILIAEPGCRVSALVDEMRTAEGDIVMLLIDSAVAGLDRALLTAAIGPLAIERAPATRIGAIDIVKGASTENIEAAARFLAAARSTTGQVLAVSPED